MNITIAEQYMEQFRRAFPVPVKRVIVTDDEMRFILRTNRMAEYCKEKADEVIEAAHLPLEAEVEVWQMRGVVFEVAMVVKFVPQLEHIPGY